MMGGMADATHGFDKDYWEEHWEQAHTTADGSDDQLVQDPVGCKVKFQPESLRCAASQSGDQCLTDAQITAIKTLHSTYKFPFAMENGLDDYPGWGVSGENTPAFGPTGGWGYSSPQLSSITGVAQTICTSTPVASIHSSLAAASHSRSSGSDSSRSNATAFG